MFTIAIMLAWRIPRLTMTTTMNAGELYNGWPNRPTWALVCWLHAYRYCYSMDATLACWKAAENTFDRSGRALTSMTEKLRRDVAANTAKIQSANFDRPLEELLDEIDFEAIADHWLVRFNGYRRRVQR
jgi:hypothetical protein